MKVKDCMCDDVCCVKPETKIKEVAKLMSENHIGSIPVCDQNQCICGIVTDRDILLRCVACDKDTNQTSVSEIMSCNVCTCKEDDDITNAQTQMSQNQILRLQLQPPAVRCFPVYRKYLTYLLLFPMPMQYLMFLLLLPTA